jgi:hypothetical protein
MYKLTRQRFRINDYFFLICWMIEHIAWICGKFAGCSWTLVKIFILPVDFFRSGAHAGQGVRYRDGNIERFRQKDSYLLWIANAWRHVVSQ